MERIIYNRLMLHLHSFEGLSSFQSAYRQFHSVETALIKIQNDLLLALDKKKISALVLLDLTAAFDTVDHSILISRLNRNFGISDSALSLLSSYLSNRTQSVNVNGHVSVASLVTTGVPQGSVLEPLLFSLYITPLTYHLNASNISFHLYADDTQLYISFSTADCSVALQHLSHTLDAVHN